MWSIPERLECEVLQKERYLNRLTFIYQSNIFCCCITNTVCECGWLKSRHMACSEWNYYNPTSSWPRPSGQQSTDWQISDLTTQTAVSLIHWNIGILASLFGTKNRKRKWKGCGRKDIRRKYIEMHGCAYSRSHLCGCCRPASGHTVRGVSERGPVINQRPHQTQN